MHFDIVDICISVLFICSVQFMCKQENSSNERPGSLKNLSLLSNIAAKKGDQHSLYASAAG